MTQGFKLVDTKNDVEKGRAWLDSGEWKFSDPGMEDLVHGLKANMNLTDDEVLQYCKGYSNGYIKSADL